MGLAPLDFIKLKEFLQSGRRSCIRRAGIVCFGITTIYQESCLDGATIKYRVESAKMFATILHGTGTLYLSGKNWE